MQYRSVVRAGGIAFASFAGLLLLLAIATAIGDVLIGRANPPTGRFIETSSGRQHVLDLAPSSATAPGAPAIVLLHGAAANLADMRLALAERLQARYRVVAIDRPGHGWSERTGGVRDASPRRQAAVLHEILGRIGVKRPVLVAHSWAGSVALAYALDYPDAVKGLVLLAPLGHASRNPLMRYVEWANMPWLGALYAHTAALPFGWLTLDSILGRAFAPQTPPPDYVERASIMLALRPSVFTAYIQDVANFASSAAMLTPRYPQIAVPTVIMTGSDDQVVFPRFQARVLARQLPNERLIVAPGIGHMLNHAAPERIVGAVKAIAEDGESGAATATPRR